VSKELKSGLFKNIFSLGIMQVANLVFPLITLPIIARIIGPEKFGVINYAAAVIAYFTLLINFGFDLTATRTIAQNKDDKEKLNDVFSDILYTKILLFLASLIVFLICLYKLPAFSSEKTVAVYSYLICVAWIITPTWLYQGLQQIQKLAVFSLVTKFLFTVSVLFLVRKAEDYYLQPLTFSIAQIITSVVSFVYCFYNYNISLKPFSLKKVWSTIAEGRMFFLSLVTINLYTSTSVVVLGLFHNSTEVGLYSAGNRLIGIAQALIFIPINYGLFPFIGTAFSKSKEEGVQILRKVLPAIVIVSIVYCLGIILASPYVVPIIYGSAFNGSIKVLVILSFIPLIINLSALFGMQAMLNLKMDNVYLRVTLIGAVFGVCINVFLSKNYGYVGTATAWLLTELIICILFYFFLLKNKVQIVSLAAFTYKDLKSVFLSIINKKEISASDVSAELAVATEPVVIKPKRKSRETVI
jgi:PST family polysaccharide transporter